MWVLVPFKVKLKWHWLFSHESKSAQFELRGPDHHLNCAIQITNRDVILHTHSQKYRHSNDIQIVQFEWSFKLRTFALVWKQSLYS